jgi:hypothetical protein
MQHAIRGRRQLVHPRPVTFRPIPERRQVQRVIEPDNPPHRQILIQRHLQIHERKVGNLRQPRDRQPNPRREPVRTLTDLTRPRLRRRRIRVQQQHPDPNVPATLRKRAAQQRVVQPHQAQRTNSQQVKRARRTGQRAQLRLGVRLAREHLGYLRMPGKRRPNRRTRRRQTQQNPSLIRHCQAIGDPLEDLQRADLTAAIDDLIHPSLRYPRSASQTNLTDTTITLHQSQNLPNIPPLQRLAQIGLPPRRNRDLHRAEQRISHGQQAYPIVRYPPRDSRAHSGRASLSYRTHRPEPDPSLYASLPHQKGPRMTTATHDPATPAAPVLDSAEAARRVLALTYLQSALAETGIQSTLARNHRLVLRYSEKGPHAPSGQTDPRLHIFLPAETRTVTTDGTNYLLDNGHAIPIEDPAAAVLIHENQTATTRI